MDGIYGINYDGVKKKDLRLKNSLIIKSLKSHTQTEVRYLLENHH